MKSAGRAGKQGIGSKVVGAVAGFFVIAALVLFIAGGVFVLSSLFHFPVHRQLWMTIDPSFSEIDRCNPGFAEKIIRAGDVVEFRFPSGHSSIDQYYYCSGYPGPEFVVENQSLLKWKVIDIGGGGDFDTGASQSGFDIRVEFQIPDEPSLEGETVSGTLKMNISYPIIYTSIHYTMTSDNVAKRVSIQIFTAEEAETFKALNDKLESVCFNTLAFCFIGGVASIALFFIIAYIEILVGKAKQKSHLRETRISVGQSHKWEVLLPVIHMNSHNIAAKRNNFSSISSPKNYH